MKPQPERETKDVATVDRSPLDVEIVLQRVADGFEVVLVPFLVERREVAVPHAHGLLSLTTVDLFQVVEDVLASGLVDTVPV